MNRERNEVRVTFRTLTPLWTGDAWRDNRQIRPSSIMGSLRFWFEVICYFSDITDESNYDNGKLKEKELKEATLKAKILDNGNDFDRIDRILAELGVSVPSRIFGCTGWKGLVRIKEINFDKNNFQNKLRGRIINGKNWFWGTPYYEGEYSILFEVEKNIEDSIFYPLLTFIEKYGFLGGKWNIGYGRVRIEKVEGIKDDEWRKDKFGFGDRTVRFSDLVDENTLSGKSLQPFNLLKYFLGINNFYCKKERDFKNKISSIPRKIKIAKFDNLNGSYVDLIKELLKKKAEMRNCLRPESSVNNKKLWNDFRHELLGTTSGGTEGTKIIPWIYEEGGQLKGGFVSIAGIINIGRKL